MYVESQAKTKYRNVLVSLRRDIIEGVYEPGQRLPTWLEIGEKFRVGVATVQKALDTLAEDGFIRARPRMSTFVVDHPPHLCNFALVMPATGVWSRYFTALRKAAKSLRAKPDMRFQEYHLSRDVGSRAEIAQLRKDIRRRRLAGILIADVWSKSELEGTGVMEEPHIPRVMLQDCPELGLPMVFPDSDSFLDRAVQYLFSKGRRRIAHLCFDYPTTRFDEFQAALEQRGVEVRPHWLQPIGLGSPFRGAAHVVNLLMHLQGGDRPDALIVHDDNLIDQAVSGLLAAGIKVPDDLEVVALCNYPAPVASALPVRHLGPDLRAILAECLRIVEMQRQGQKPPPVKKIPALFAEELGSDKGGIEPMAE